MTREEKIKGFLKNISPEEFERLCVQYLMITRNKSLKIKGTHYIKDGGKDIIGISDTIPYEIWAECKKYSRAIGLEELSKNVVLVISEGINELIYFSVSRITENAQKHISNVAAKRDFAVSFYYDKNLVHEFLKLPLFQTENVESDIVAEQHKGLHIKHFLSKYQFSSIYESDHNISLQRDNFFYIDIFFKNWTTEKVDDINFEIEPTHHFRFITKPYNDNFSLNAGCDRVVQIKCEILTNNQKCKIPNIIVKYTADSKQHKCILRNGLADAMHVLRFPLIGVGLNNWLKNLEKYKLEKQEHFPFVINISGSSGVGKTRLMNEIEILAEKWNWNIKKYDAKKQNDLSIVKELLSSFIGIPYYSGNISVSAEDIKKVLKIQGGSEKIAEKIYSFIYQNFYDEELLYFIEDAFIYYLKHPFYPYLYLISIDNIQELDGNMLSFLEKILLKLERIETSLIVLFGTNTDFNDSEEFIEFTQKLDGLSETFYQKFQIEDMSNSDAITLYAHALANPSMDLLSLLIKKTGKRPYDIIMTIKFLQDEKIINWKNSNIWHINNYENFKKFLTHVPQKSEQLLAKRLSYQQKEPEYWNNFKKVIKCISYFQGHVPIDFLLYNNISEEQQEKIVKSSFVKYDESTPTISFFHDNIYRFFIKKSSYTYDRVLASKIIEWIFSEYSLTIDKKNHIIFKCYLDINNYSKAYSYGIAAAEEYEKNYNFEKSCLIWTDIIENPAFSLSTSQEFEIKFFLANSYREHIDQNKGVQLFNELYIFYTENEEELQLPLHKKDNFFHRLINANIITNNLEKALSIIKYFELTELSSQFYHLVLFDRYALIYLGLGDIDKAEEYIKKAFVIAEKENSCLWKSLVYSDYGYIAYRGLCDKKLTLDFFKRAFHLQDKQNQTLRRKSELLHQKAFFELLQNNNKEAFLAAKASVKLCHKLNSSFMGAKALNILAISCLKLDMKDDALAFWKDSSCLCIKTTNLNTHIRVYNNIGAYYNLQGNFKEALINYQIALKLFNQLKVHETSYKELFFNLLIYYFSYSDFKLLQNLLEEHAFSELEELYSQLIAGDTTARHFDIIKINNYYFSF